MATRVLLPPRLGHTALGQNRCLHFTGAFSILCLLGGISVSCQGEKPALLDFLKGPLPTQENKCVVDSGGPVCRFFAGNEFPYLKTNPNMVLDWDCTPQALWRSSKPTKNTGCPKIGGQETNADLTTPASNPNRSFQVGAAFVSTCISQGETQQIHSQHGQQILIFVWGMVMNLFRNACASKSRIEQLMTVQANLK